MSAYSVARILNIQFQICVKNEIEETKYIKIESRDQHFDFMIYDDLSQIQSISLKINGWCNTHDFFPRFHSFILGCKNLKKVSIIINSAFTHNLSALPNILIDIYKIPTICDLYFYMVCSMENPNDEIEKKTVELYKQLRTRFTDAFYLFSKPEIKIHIYYNIYDINISGSLYGCFDSDNIKSDISMLKLVHPSLFSMLCYQI